jgi:Pup amidohydrolase
MARILAGLETEYGLLVSGHGAEEQIEGATALVRAYPGECLSLWDYRYESPRNDLRGFKQAHLTIDPEDAKFDVGRARGPDADMRSDRILSNGARFYNDHGHPEYSTPECWSLAELAQHDRAGELAVLRAAQRFSQATGLEATLYKNNTDFHGASYGTHESYLAPRALGFEQIFSALAPMLVVRQVLTGAGKVGVETGASCPFQMSARADFFSEVANVDTLFRRPLFNTRDEPHADPAKWIRVHVINGDANMMTECTVRKVGLIKLALRLAEVGEAPLWRLSEPVRSFRELSRDLTGSMALPLEARSWTTPRDILESYFAAAEAVLEFDGEMASLIAECRLLLEQLSSHGYAAIAPTVDWAAKRVMLDSIVASEELAWNDPVLQAYDLEYHNVDPEVGLFHALEQMGSVNMEKPLEDLGPLLERHTEPTRAFARGVAVHRFKDRIQTAAWRSITFKDGEDLLELELPPNLTYPTELADVENVDSFMSMIGGLV